MSKFPAMRKKVAAAAKAPAARAGFAENPAMKDKRAARQPPSAPPQRSGASDAADPRRPIPPDPGKTTDVEIEEKKAPRKPRRR